MSDRSKGVAWLIRNAPTLYRWGRYIAGLFRDAKRTGNLVVALSLALLLSGCAVLDFLAKLPDIPQPPGPPPVVVVTPTPTQATPTPCPEGWFRCPGAETCCRLMPEPTATPTVAPTATPTVPPVASSCAAVEAIQHTMAPGNHCHAWHPVRQDGRVVAIRCLVDSTIRPICDTDHMDNWNTFCGKRTHDPDYSKPVGAQAWTIAGAEDFGPNGDPDHPSDRDNYAQRWIQGEPGAGVNVTVCIRADARTPDGCRIPRQGDGCGHRPFVLPVGE